MVTAGFPFVATDHIEVRTLTGEAPAIVQCPHRADVVFSNILKKHGEIYAI